MPLTSILIPTFTPLKITMALARRTPVTRHAIGRVGDAFFAVLGGDAGGIVFVAGGAIVLAEVIGDHMAGRAGDIVWSG
ncbi:MAG: hypothetical protein RLZZ157_1114 [Pseudomonadota bacterium]